MREETMRLIREEEDRIRKREEMFKVIPISHKSQVVSVKSPFLPPTRRVPASQWGLGPPKRWHAYNSGQAPRRSFLISDEL